MQRCEIQVNNSDLILKLKHFKSFKKSHITVPEISLMVICIFCTEEEKGLVDEVFNNAIDALSDEDKKLPQVEAVLPLLRKGIGIHHGGLLPLLKETIEILFSEGLIKVILSSFFLTFTNF
jgi:hypothetical protein